MSLTRYLMWQTAVWTSVIALLGTTVIVVQGHHALRKQQIELTITLKRILELQTIGFDLGGGRQLTFPDWSVVSQTFQSSTGCVTLYHLDGTLWRSECHGSSIDRSRAPRWYQAVYRWTFGDTAPITQPIHDERTVAARLEFIPNGVAELDASWSDVAHLGSVAGLTALAMSAVIFVLTRRAVRPTSIIVDGISAIERGDPRSRLPSFLFDEFTRISSAFNALSEQLHASDHARKVLAARVLNVQDDERRELARNLHDEFGQHLTALNALVATARRALDGGNAAQSVAPLMRVEEIIAQMHQQVRGMMTKLRPPGLDELGLSECLQQMIREWNVRRKGEVTTSLTLSADIDALPKSIASHLYRIVQALLTNAQRHADATSIQVNVSRNSTAPLSKVILEVIDDGHLAESALNANTGYGLLGVRERVESLHGQMILHLTPTNGLRVEIMVPVIMSADEGSA